mmetsp:Transcript_134861/g.430996  ORF Transcript_134861/g.430996 Transcript_134861/m.430996 type:complete len:269 (+) Transcript_134861:90-896(+)
MVAVGAAALMLRTAAALPGATVVALGVSTVAAVASSSRPGGCRGARIAGGRLTLARELGPGPPMAPGDPMGVAGPRARRATAAEGHVARRRAAPPRALGRVPIGRAGRPAALGRRMAMPARRRDGLGGRWRGGTAVMAPSGPATVASRITRSSCARMSWQVCCRWCHLGPTRRTGPFCGPSIASARPRAHRVSATPGPLPSKWPTSRARLPTSRKWLLPDGQTLVSSACALELWIEIAPFGAQLTPATWQHCEVVQRWLVQLWRRLRS